MGGSLVLPGHAVIPKGYGESMVLYSTKGCEVLVDGAPVHPQTGRLYVIPAGKAVKVPFEVGRYILETGAFPYLDVVRVREEETDEGILYDVDAAKKDALMRSEVADDLAFKRYVEGVVEDYVKRNKPVPQPPDSILRIMEHRGYKLEQYGIVPIGWKSVENEKLTAVSAENAALKEKLEAMQAQMNAFIAGQQSGQAEERKKGK